MAETKTATKKKITSKPTTKKTVTKPKTKKEETKKKTIKKEAAKKVVRKKDVIDLKQVEDLKENLKQEETVNNVLQNEDNKVEVKDQKAKLTNTTRTLLLVVVLLATALIISVFINLNPRKTYTLSEIFPEYQDTTKISLPVNYYLTQDGQLMYIDGDYIKIAGGIFAEEDTDNTYEAMIEYYESVSDVENILIGSREYKKFTQPYEEDTVTYYFSKVDTHIVEAVFLNLNTDIEQEILENVK